jgi:hypothetical protein
MGSTSLVFAAAVLLAAAAPEYGRISGLMSVSASERREAARELLAAGQPALVPGLVDAVFFTPKPLRAEILQVLKGLSGEDAGSDYYDWVELVGRREDLAAGPGYLEWKLSLLSRIDPAYRRLLYPGVPSRVRLEEVVWGGVRLDGIPSLDGPPRVAAGQAGLDDGERVFGVSLGGEHAAYPHRYLSWHEMVNDTLGGEPFVLSY